MFKKSILTPLFSLFCLFALSSVAFAQGTTSRITGVVTDGSGGVVPGAKVTLTNEGTGISLNTETGDSGSYTFDLIQAGTYQIQLKKQALKSLSQKEIQSMLINRQR